MPSGKMPRMFEPNTVSAIDSKTTHKDAFIAD